MLESTPSPFQDNRELGKIPDAAERSESNAWREWCHLILGESDWSRRKRAGRNKTQCHIQERSC